MLSKNKADTSNPRHQKQVEKIQRFNLKTQHIGGKENCIVDALSRLTQNFMQSCYRPEIQPCILPLSKKSALHAKQLEVTDPKVLEI